MTKINFSMSDKTTQNSETIILSLKLTICGSLQWKDLGKAVGVDIERATGQVLKGDLQNIKAIQR